MKSSVLLPLIASGAFVAICIAGPSSADYQAGIREATERYRGDFGGTISMVVYEEASFGGPAVCLAGCNPFPYQPFVLRHAAKLADIDANSVTLQRFTPNQSMQLTPSRTAFTFYHD